MTLSAAPAHLSVFWMLHPKVFRLFVHVQARRPNHHTICGLQVKEPVRVLSADRPDCFVPRDVTQCAGASKEPVRDDIYLVNTFTVWFVNRFVQPRFLNILSLYDCQKAFVTTALIRPADYIRHRIFVQNLRHADYGGSGIHSKIEVVRSHQGVLCVHQLHGLVALLGEERVMGKFLPHHIIWIWPRTIVICNHNFAFRQIALNAKQSLMQIAGTETCGNCDCYVVQHYALTTMMAAAGMSAFPILPLSLDQITVITPLNVSAPTTVNLRALLPASLFNCTTLPT